jgi:hypothetical protein
MLGAWTSANIWNLLLGSFSLATLIGMAAAAVAVLSPPFLSALIPNLRWIAVYVALGAFSYSFVAGKFYHDGLTAEQSEWDAALAREAVDGEKARRDAERSVARDTPDSLRTDPRNRDNWK